MSATANPVRLPDYAVEQLRAVCRDAWLLGLLCGCNGNVSLLLPAAAVASSPTEAAPVLCGAKTPEGKEPGAKISDADEAAASGAAPKPVAAPVGRICITRSGAAKGRLTAADCCLMDAGTGGVLLGGPPSSESAMHLAVYAARPRCRAIVHVHPRHLLALSLRCPPEAMLRLPLFEADVWRARLGFAPALPPGGAELAQAVGRAAAERPAVWMAGHGLCCAGEDLTGALALAEELEHLAAMQLLTLDK